MDVFVSIVVLEFWLVGILVIGRVPSMMVRPSSVVIVVTAIEIILVVISSPVFVVLLPVSVLLLPVAIVLSSTSGLSVALVVVVISPIVAILVII